LEFFSPSHVGIHLNIPFDLEIGDGTIKQHNKSLGDVVSTNRRLHSVRVGKYLFEADLLGTYYRSLLSALFPLETFPAHTSLGMCYIPM
jgi:hypothetical protein